MTSIAAGGYPAPPRAATRSTVRTSGSISHWRRNLSWALGLVWLLDAGLQYQPYMFTTDFPNQVIKPVGEGSPAWVSSPTHWSGTLMAGHINVWNALFATVQLAIAVGFFFRPTLKLALASSMVWSLLVWWLGEGLGGVLAGPVSPLMGLPGAVIIYALIALLIWPKMPLGERNGAVADASPLGVVVAKLIWLVFWASFVFETLRPADRSPSALHDMVVGMESGEPSWIKAIDRAGARFLAHHGTQVSIVLAVLFGVIAVSVFVPAITRAGVLLAVVLAGLIWVFGEDFGALATGQATDPNSGPLLAIYALCFWPISRGRVKLADPVVTPPT